MIIDPQNDFCDIPKNKYQNPALPIKGSNNDMKRLAKFILANINNISEITITLDSHYRMDIAHTCFWRRGDNNLEPFSKITSDDIIRGSVTPKTKDNKKQIIRYFEYIEKSEITGLTIWPVHCEIGTWGNNINKHIQVSRNLWEDKNSKKANILLKGLDPLREQFSIFSKDTRKNKKCINRKLIKNLDKYDILLIAGESSSHCVKRTIEDLIYNSNRKDLQRIMVLTDCMSPVHGYEKRTRDFMSDMEDIGVTITNSIEVMSILK
ncbi:nicotinamidase [Candidatus Kinetoplastibacterium galatii TCC219]|uniref:Nicotinamidase n=2 Tax=Candidatus Kinetoplastidibacterium galati TaxID=994695 RepID=M1M9X2_9PROT|nr:nicotinamidase [Candidatus Kinetoplastibacterium galatii TCC219]